MSRRYLEYAKVSLSLTFIKAHEAVFIDFEDAEEGDDEEVGERLESKDKYSVAKQGVDLKKLDDETESDPEHVLVDHSEVVSMV